MVSSKSRIQVGKQVIFCKNLKQVTKNLSIGISVLECSGRNYKFTSAEPIGGKSIDECIQVYIKILERKEP
jgi:hypothetical protein